jgi:hypothetical protein
MSKIPENRTVVGLLDSTKPGDPPNHKRFHPVETVSSSGNARTHGMLLWKIDDGEGKPPHHSLTNSQDSDSWEWETGA